MDIVLLVVRSMWKANRNLYAIYRTALISVTLDDFCLPQSTPFSKLCIFLSYLRSGRTETSNLV